jgi:hypothetical protein
MHESHLWEAAKHAFGAAMIAPIIGIALAAVLDWIPKFPKDATVHGMLHRVLEGVLGGALEGFIVTLVVAGVSILK